MKKVINDTALEPADLPGRAMYNFYVNGSKEKLWIPNTYGPKEEMPLKVYFRELKNMPEIEITALQHCKGKVLDIGAGAGSHTLALQQKGFDVTALEISPKAVNVMKLRGVKKVVEQDVFAFETGGFDTLLLLMNGIGFTGNINGLKLFLQHSKKLLNEGGQMIFDSSNVAYVYDNQPPEMENYYGEIKYQYEYKKYKTGWFSWLYIDEKTLVKTATDEGWKTEILYKDEFDQYLARLTVNH